MSYIDDIVEMLHEEMPIPGNDALVHAYAQLVLTTGEVTTLEHVHDAWAIATHPERPDHRSLVPFAQLPREVQELDRTGMDAIHRAARRRRPPGRGAGGAAAARVRRFLDARPLDDSGAEQADIARVVAPDSPNTEWALTAADLRAVLAQLKAVYEDDPCRRCVALGRVNDEQEAR